MNTANNCKQKMSTIIIENHLNEVENHDPPGGAEGVVEEIDDKHSDLVSDHQLDTSSQY